MSRFLDADVVDMLSGPAEQALLAETAGYLERELAVLEGELQTPEPS